MLPTHAVCTPSIKKKLRLSRRRTRYQLFFRQTPYKISHRNVIDCSSFHHRPHSTGHRHWHVRHRQAQTLQIDASGWTKLVSVFLINQLHHSSFFAQHSDIGLNQRKRVCNFTACLDICLERTSLRISNCRTYSKRQYAPVCVFHFCSILVLSHYAATHITWQCCEQEIGTKKRCSEERQADPVRHHNHDMHSGM